MSIYDITDIINNESTHGLSRIPPNLLVSEVPMMVVHSEILQVFVSGTLW
jgi:hypothetical protein